MHSRHNSRVIEGLGEVLAALLTLLTRCQEEENHQEGKEKEIDRWRATTEKQAKMREMLQVLVHYLVQYSITNRTIDMSVTVARITTTPESPQTEKTNLRRIANLR